MSKTWTARKSYVWTVRFVANELNTYCRKMYWESWAKKFQLS